MSGIEMNKVDRQNITGNLDTLEKWLILDDNYQKLSVQKTIFTKRMVDIVIKNESPSLEYCRRIIKTWT